MQLFLLKLKKKCTVFRQEDCSIMVKKIVDGANKHNIDKYGWKLG